MAEIALVIAAFGLPLLIGAVTVVLGRPWWWGAVAAIVVFLVAAIAPTPEEGESRLALGDLLFLLVVALVVAALTWLGAWIAGRLRRP